MPTTAGIETVNMTEQVNNTRIDSRNICRNWNCIVSYSLDEY